MIRESLGEGARQFDREELVGRLADELAERLASGDQIDLEFYCQRYPELAADVPAVYDSVRAFQLFRPELDGSDDNLELSGELNSGPPVGERLGDFEVLQQIGRGGMGVVYEAEQLSMGRRVALKVLPFAAMLDKQQLNRFKNEARAAGTLDHPNIVAVHSVGTERGVHYYAMQLVEGQSLADLIADLRTSERTKCSRPEIGNGQSSTRAVNNGVCRDTRSTRISPASSGGDTSRHVQAVISTVSNFGTRAFVYGVAELGIQAAQALDHAHKNGIIHRDVKPGNLLVDGEGKLWVTDFGLARIEADAGVTMTGDIVGTLRYMSPEQALASRAVVDQRADIYSLGVTLYELATLQPAFGGRDRGELLKQIAVEEPPAPAHLNKSIPVELDTIILKAIAKNPEDRYATALELADDLRCFLENRPIKARRIGRAERFWRWSKRNPVVSALTAATALLATMVAVVATIGYSRTAEALAEAQNQTQLAIEQREFAERQFRAARDAVDRMLTNAASQLVNVPHSGAVRRKLLEDALEFYEAFLAQKGNDPVIRHESALAYERVGKIRRELGDAAGAQAAYRQAIALWEGLVAEFPRDAAYQSGLAWCCNRLAYANLFRDNEENVRGNRRYLKLMRQLVADHPTNPEYRKSSVYAHVDVGNALKVAGRLSEALPYFRKAVVEWEAFDRDDPQVAQDLYLRAFIHHWLGAALRDAGELEEADKELSLAHDLLEKRLATDPGSRSFRHKVAHIKQYMTRLRKLQGRATEAEEYERQALAILEQLVVDFPSEAEYRRRLTDVLLSLGTTLADGNRNDEAELIFRKALEHREALFEANPDDGFAVRNLARCSFSLGLRRYAADELNEDAIQLFRQTQQLYETYLRDHADDRQIVDSLGYFLVLCPASQFQDPIRAIQLVKPLLQQSPRDGDLWGTLGTAHYMSGEWEKALDALNKANTLHNGEAEDLFPIAMCQWQLGQFEQARQSYDQAIDHVEGRRRWSQELLLLRRMAADVLGVNLDEPHERQEAGARK